MDSPIKCYGYARVSGISQCDGEGIPRQKEKIEAYAKAHNLEVVQIFEDGGVSGCKDVLDRDGLTDLFVAIKSNGVRTVLVESMDRIARKVMVGEVILTEFKRLGVKVLSCESGADLTIDDDTDAERTLIRQMLAVVAQWERAKLVQRMRAAKLRIRKTTGAKTDGKYAFGKHPNKPDEQDTLSKIIALRNDGLSYAQVAERLNAENVKTRLSSKGKGSKWHATTVQRILSSESANINK